MIERGEYQNHIPLLALIETACVVSRLTNDPESASLSVSFVSSHAEMYDTADLLERSIEIGIATKASGFDVIFMACADVTGSLLITDDRKMYERARDVGILDNLIKGMGGRDRLIRRLFTFPIFLMRPGINDNTRIHDKS